MSDAIAIQKAIENVSRMPHLEAVRDLPELFEAEVDNRYSKGGKLPFRAVVMNMERGANLEGTCALLQYHPALCGADFILANELDIGMLRTGNRDTPREIAQALGLNVAFGTEFLSAAAWKDGNTRGLHGNAIFSRYPLSRVKVLHLPIEYDWFYMPGDCRLGTRIAILAQVDLAGRPAGIVCTHLENRADPQQRARQLRFLLEQIEAYLPGMPVLIGGDMNTNTVSGNDEDAYDVFLGNQAEQLRRSQSVPALEPQMALAEEFGYSYTDCNIMNKFTRRKLMPDGSVIRMNLDWFFQRGFICGEPARAETIFDYSALVGAPEALKQWDGRELADHDAIAVQCALSAE